jgi:hypothetical protein
MTRKEMIETLYGQIRKYIKYTEAPEVTKDPVTAFKLLEDRWKFFEMLLGDGETLKKLMVDPENSSYVSAMRQSFAALKADVTRRGVNVLRTASGVDAVAGSFNDLFKAEKFMAKQLQDQTQKPGNVGVLLVGAALLGAVLWLSR